MSKKIDIKGIAIKTAATGGGAVAAAKISSLPFVSKLKLPVRGLMNVVVGNLLPKYMGKGKKGSVAEDFGQGMVAIGALQLANATVFKANPVGLAGVGELATLGTGYDQIVSGVGEMPTLGDPNDPSNPYE